LGGRNGGEETTRQENTDKLKISLNILLRGQVRVLSLKKEGGLPHGHTMKELIRAPWTGRHKANLFMVG
jgi:hypothetical protein